MTTRINVSYHYLNRSVSAGAHSSVPQETVRRLSSQPKAHLCTFSQGIAVLVKPQGLSANSPVTVIKHLPAMTVFQM